MLRFWNFTPEILSVSHNNSIITIGKECYNDIERPKEGMITITSVLYGSAYLALTEDKITIATKGDLRITQCDDNPSVLVIGYEED